MPVKSIFFAIPVQNVRQQLGLPQENLVKAQGISFVTVNRWGNGQTAPSKIAQISFGNYSAEMIEQGKLKNDRV
ncbi:XRE family transcriptional regulator [Shewanella baltica OS223]|uniref:transcriptional regulator n=1 Tax=Shewanella baltica TaxID=62322 RepID=UPI0001883DD6|nr:transcriptional regulator [Shewanella baltica]ACK44921.1 XRE family transcriptional regulator [Shewanella baltica OS223]